MAAVTTAGGAVERSGHLRKLKTMKKKFFVLRGDSAECSARLEYYESEKKYKAGAVPRRALPLRTCFNITRRLDLKQKHVIALFTKEEQFCVVAESEADLHEWLSALLRLHRADDQSDQITHPIQHVWQVNVQKKGLGASKNIQGLYNLCLTDKTLTLVKIKSHNNIISELGIPERVEYSLKNIRRCGDSECFFYMEVGRQTVTGAGELWMLADDSNIAQSMHSTIYHAMRNCAKESENERDHIVLPSKGSLDLSQAPPKRRQTYSDGSGRAGLINERGLCVGSCIKQCVCQSGTTSIDDSAQPLPLLNNHNPDVDPQHNPLTSNSRVMSTHHRTVSLPAGCAFTEPLRIVHERTRSAPLTGEELDKVVVNSRTGNGTEAPKKQWCRRASTGTRFSKLSPAHTKNVTPLRHRCDSVPARTATTSESSGRRTPSAANEESWSEAEAEWGRTPRIPEEPDWWSRGGYLPMGPAAPHASSGSVCSGTPSTHARFSDYPLEPATSLLGEGRAGRAYSVGCRPAPAAPRAHRHRAYSAGARRPPPDLMELDFSPGGGGGGGAGSPGAAVRCSRRPDLDEYVDMSPRNASLLSTHAAPALNNNVSAPDGYVEMSYGKSRPAASVLESGKSTPHGSQTIFPFSPEDEAPHPLTTVSETSEDNSGSASWSRPPPAAPAPVAASPPAGYVRLAPPAPPAAAPAPPPCSPPGYVRLPAPAAAAAPAPDTPDPAEGGSAAVFPGALHYAALDLEAGRPGAAPPPPHYTRIDFLRSEQLHADHAHAH